MLVSTDSRLFDHPLRPLRAAGAILLCTAVLSGCSADQSSSSPGAPPPDSGSPDAAEAEASKDAAPESSTELDAGPDSTTEPDATGPDSAVCEDSACDPGSYCHEGECVPCLPDEVPECENGLVYDHSYGNGCIVKVCCANGTDLDPATGTCVGFPLLDIAMCPWRLGYACVIKMISDGAGMPITTLDTFDIGAFAIANDGGATVHIASMGLTAATSPDFEIVTSPLPTELGPGESLVVQFRYTPQTDERDEGEFVVTSDADNGTELRVPLIGDTWFTPCTSATVKQDCILGQYCDPWVEPNSCAECNQPQDPLCTNGTTYAIEPEGSYNCVHFVCQCPSGWVYLSSVPGCAEHKPCDASCASCETVCTVYPEIDCTEDKKVQHCLD